MKKILLFAMMLAMASVASAVTIVDEDFEGAEWPTGAINAGYTLPSGWLRHTTTVDLSIVTAQNHTSGGSKSLYCPANTDNISVSFNWTPVDPTDSTLLVVSYWAYKGAGKNQKGVALENSFGVAGLCAPRIQWYTNTSTQTLSRIRDRRNCTPVIPPDPPAGLCYLTPQNLEFTQDSGAWNEWSAVFKDGAPGATFYKNWVTLHGGSNTFGVPNPAAPYDNFQRMEFGDPHSQTWGDTDLNGEVWYDDVKITYAEAEVQDWATY
jgi:hypothetical protein